jgi:hypothetical protein
MSMNKSIYLKVPLAMVLMVLCAGLQAQKKHARTSRNTDTLATIREFVRVCNVYKQLPLYLHMEIVNTTNFVTGQEDTTHSEALFYMKPGTTYIRFGETEQLVNDSMALLVSSNLQRMILYSNAQPVLQRMNAMTGILQQDSSLQEMARSFTAQPSPPGQQAAGIILTGRNLLYGTSLPKESIELQYDPATGNPSKVITLKRTLLPVKEDDYKILSGKADMTDKLITIAGKGHYLIKEQVVTFIFKKIEHNAAMTMPATIADRIVKNEQGNYTPVKAYEGYAVTIN